MPCHSSRTLKFYKVQKCNDLATKQTHAQSRKLTFLVCFVFFMSACVNFASQHTDKKRQDSTDVTVRVAEKPKRKKGRLPAWRSSLYKKGIIVRSAHSGPPKGV